MLYAWLAFIILSTRNRMQTTNFNLGCLHPVALVISDDAGFNPSTQRHYRRLIYYLYIHSYMFRSFDHHQAEKYITTLDLIKQRIRCQLSSICFRRLPGNSNNLISSTMWMIQIPCLPTPSSLRNIYKTYTRFLHIHIAMCVQSLVEMAPGVPELCPDIHTHTNINFYRYRLISMG
jgi:hypothetical protein